MDTHSNWTDRSAAVRPGEELDAEKLATYLRQHIPDLEGSAALEIEQFPSGHSNLTYLLRLGQREMVLRRPPFGAKIKTAHDMGREYNILLHLAKVYSRVPRVLAYWYRHERAARIYDGPDEVHKLSVARHILRRYE